ncbi:complement decay-accelerating factor, GPI-anchored isoform X3 [Chelmon rostratus]|uniref:complement decay-accelerating factor, GPI-anchored isoform X3 n=1 Tax=Chelmon rostratus TaxID=109905 RepID=UPI001BEA3F7F|nr:complement decay-accelerating factor, GPI-anchored isoform X3 [Chelmon rostratus]
MTGSGVVSLRKLNRERLRIWMFSLRLRAGMEVLLDTCGRRGVRPLLLLCLFVVKATADCPKPQGRGNIVLTNEALLMNDFPEGVVVTLECANGYYKESGSGITTCIDGNWNEPDLICQKRDCGLPKSQPNMSFNTSAGTLFGAVIRVVCDKGYQLSGSSYKQCYTAGWSGRAKCQIVTCDTPAEVANGRSSWDSEDVPAYGEIINYTCDEGYTLVGKDSIVCSETGEYDSQPPECKGSRGILTAEEEAATTSVTSTTSFQDRHNEAVDANKDNGYIPVIVSVICVSLVVCIVILFLHKFLLKRKGSYDTREDLKPELLQFQNL